MVCPKCGAVLNEGDAFCSTCGFRFDEAAQPPPVVPAPLPLVIPGSKMIKVCGILFIVFSALSIAVSLVLAASMNGIINTVGILFLIIVDGGALAIGIIGVLKCRCPNFGLFFILAGSIYIPLQLTFIILLANGSLGIGGLVLGILYIVGGVRLRKADAVIV